MLYRHHKRDSLPFSVTFCTSTAGLRSRLPTGICWTQTGVSIVWYVRRWMLRHAVSCALNRHKHVTLSITIGNHDLASAVWLMEAMSMFYEDEPRVTVDTSPSHFKYHRFGKNLIGIHHGYGAPRGLAICRASWQTTALKIGARQFTAHGGPAISTQRPRLKRRDARSRVSAFSRQRMLTPRTWATDRSEPCKPSCSTRSMVSANGTRSHQK